MNTPTPTNASAPALAAHTPDQPPVDNAHVAPGCELFSSVPLPAFFVPSYGTGLEVFAYGLGDEGGPEYRVCMKQNGCFVAMTRSSIDAKMIAAMPDMLKALQLMVGVFGEVEPSMTPCSPQAAIREAKAAIDKATRV